MGERELRFVNNLRCVALRCVVITKPSKTESTTKHINFSDMCVKGKFFVTTKLTNRDLRFLADAQNDDHFSLATMERGIKEVRSGSADGQT